MTLDQLNMFIAVVDMQTFSAAAKKLYISQPSISVAIKNLEEELKISLFDRSHYRPKLTAAGQEIYLKAQQMLGLEKELRLSAELLANGEERQIKIVLDIVAPLPLILHLIGAYFTHEKACKLELSFCVLGSGLKDVLMGEADLYIGPIFEAVENLEAHFHSYYYMIPVLSRNHAYGKLPLKQLKAHINEVSRVILRDGQARSHEGSNIYVEDYLIKKETIVAGLGWGRLPLWNIEGELKRGSLIDIRELFSSMKIKGEIFIVPKEKYRGKHLNALLKIFTG